jgi:phosphoenolpyruvate carboxykinase (ATP)
MTQKPQPRKPLSRSGSKTAKKTDVPNASEHLENEGVPAIPHTNESLNLELPPPVASRAKGKPPKKVVAKAASKTAPALEATVITVAPDDEATSEPVPAPKAEQKAEVRTEPKADVKPLPKPEIKPEIKPEVKLVGKQGKPTPVAKGAQPQAVPAKALPQQDSLVKGAQPQVSTQQVSGQQASVQAASPQQAQPQTSPVQSPKPSNEAPLPLPQFLVQKHGIRNTANLFANLGAAQLYEHILFLREGVISAGGAIAIDTTPHTGLLGDHVTIVEEAITKENIVWNDAHKPFDQTKFNALKARITGYLQGKNVYVQDCFVGSDTRLRMPIRVITEHASQSLAARNLFIEAAAHELKGFDPRMTILSVPNFKAVPELDGTDSEAFAIIDFSQRLAIIGGTKHFGEIKNIAFTVMSYAMPPRKVLPLHSAAITGSNSDTTLLLGRSGTGKTTLSTDGVRQMIGDDAHAWGDEGVFNLESGSASIITALSPTAEPLLSTITRSFGTILENVKLDPVTRTVTASDTQSYAIYSRVSLDAFAQIAPKNRGIHPKHVILLTNDAFGVLPPVARLSHEQAVFFFLSGYTSFTPKSSEKNNEKSSEKNVNALPEASFSACMGEAQMIEDPIVYGNLFREKLRRNRSNVWLVNTGWQGGSVGAGARIKLEHSRAILNAIMNGALQSVEYSIDPVFGVQIPATCQGLPAAMLNPRTAWADRVKYDQTAQTLVKLLNENFKRFASAVDPIVGDALNPASQQLPPAKGNVPANPANTPSTSTSIAPSTNAPNTNAPSANAPSAGASSANAPSANAPSANAPSANAPSVNAPSANAPSAAQAAQRQMRVPQPPPKGRGNPNIQAVQQQNDANVPDDNEASDNELAEQIPVTLFGHSDSPENAPEFRPTLESALDAAFEGNEDLDADENDGEQDGDAESDVSQDGQNPDNQQFRGGRRRGGRGRGGRGRRR